VTDTALIKSALAEQADRGEAETIYNALDLHRAALERKVPTGVMTYAYAEAALKTELRANDKLREADPAKVLGAFSYGLQLGLVPGPLGLVHFIPFGNEVVFLVGYRGYIELAYRSGMVKDVSASLVYENEPFKVLGGDAEKIIHEVLPPHERGETITAAYAIASLKTGGKVRAPIWEQDWETARAASQLGAKNRGPWSTTATR
jgi:recombination protein RecT